MIYPELAAFNSTPAQDLGLAVQFKQDTDRKSTTPGEYLATIVSGVLDEYASRHVGQVKTTRVVDAFDKATDQEKQQIASILKISLTVDVPADKAAKAE